MKIGILTFHCAHNYGAILQCYALQEVLKKMGHTVEVIDYRPLFLKEPYSIFSLHRIFSRDPSRLIKRVISELLSLPKQIKRYNNFEHFIKTQLSLSAPGIPSYYDIYIMGSDQIWNPRITRGFDGNYFGYLPFPKGHRKYIAYAASMEVENLSNTEKDYLQEALHNFDAISVREEQLACLLRSLTNNKIHNVLDPTLLADPSIWNRFLFQLPMRKKYVLVYQVRIDKNVERIANHIAKQLNAKVIVLSAPTWRKSKRVYQTESPQSFINWIKHACCVITTSFHGVAFSVTFKRAFYFVSLGAGDIRAVSLLKMMGLDERVIDKAASPLFCEIDYNGMGIDDRLNKYRKISFDFLSSSV